MGPASSAGRGGGGAARRLGRLLYRFRGYTPLPLVLILLVSSRPSAASVAAGLPLVLGGEALRLWSLRHIGGASRSKRLGAASLVTSGPFALSRNPLYLGNLILSSGLAVFSGIGWLPPLLWVLFAVQYVPIVLAEEAELAERFPGEFAAYARAVPRFVPRPGGLGGARAGEAALGLVAAARVERRTLAATVLLLLAMLARAGLGGGAA